MTAAEAAAALTKEHGAAAECASDDDCTFTMYAENACCPMLCAPRAVTKKEAQATEDHAKGCPRAAECPLPSCHPPRFSTVPACVQGRCEAKIRDRD